MTKTEQAILIKVRAGNQLGALVGLETSPFDANFSDKDQRFIKRLYDRGAIVWVHYTPKYGAGWAVLDLAEKFVRG